MKHMIRTEMEGFLQFVSLPDSRENFVYPTASQLRGSSGFLLRLKELLEEAVEHDKHVEKTYHEDDTSREAFNYGKSFFSAGDIPIVMTSQRRQVTIYASGSALFTNANPTDLIKAVDIAYKELK